MWIPKAYTVLEQVGIAKDKQLGKWWKGQISAFGASVAQGSLLAAVAFFSKNDDERAKLMEAIQKVLGIKESLRVYVQPPVSAEVREKVMDAAVALKLAMNLYDLEKERNSDDESKQDESELLV